MDFFTIGYFGAVCALLAWVVPLLDKGFHRFLFGLCAGIIMATAMPYLHALWM